jgi:hypothetical protein
LAIFHQIPHQIGFIAVETILELLQTLEEMVDIPLGTGGVGHGTGLSLLSRAGSALGD